MADTGKNAITTHSGNASTTTFAIGFGFLDVDHIKVEVGLSPPVEKTLGTDYTISSDGNNVEFVTPPPLVTDNVKFTRQTFLTIATRASPPVRYVDFSAGSGVTATDLDNATLEGIYYAQEVEDKI